jgi:hypothetical protein
VTPHLVARMIEDMANVLEAVARNEAGRRPRMQCWRVYAIPPRAT